MAERTLERVLIGIVATLASGAIGWLCYSQVLVLQTESAQAERLAALSFRVGLVEARLAGNYFYPREMAEQEHAAMRGNINHNWDVIQRLEARIQAHEHRRRRSPKDG